MCTFPIHLTIEEAKSIFGVSEITPIATLRHWQNALVDKNSSQPYIEMKFMLLLPKTYLNYKSNEVKYAIQNLLNLIIKDIFNGEKTIPLNSLKFLYSIVWYHRNIESYRTIHKLRYEKKFLEEIRKNLLMLGAIKFYQKAIF